MRADDTTTARAAVDPAAFEALYREHLPAVRRFLARRVDEPAVVADLTAEVFLAAITSASRYTPERGSPGGWLIGIARHVLADHHRRRSREQAALRRIDTKELLDADSEQRIAARIDAETDARVLLRRIAALPRAQRDLVELVAVEGLQLTDAAAVLGIRPGAARARYHRARRALAQHPAPHTAAPGTARQEAL